MIYYTTDWAKKAVRTEAQYKEWSSSLKPGDRCLVQEFVPQGNSCLDSQVECWRFWEAKYHGTRVFYDNDTRPLNEHGACVYWNSDDEWGEVFAARIVPWHSDTAPEEGRRFRACHAAVYEPALWDAWRCLVLLKDGPSKHKIAAEIRRTFKRQYWRGVNEGSLYVIFDDDRKVEEFCKSSGALYLYSESVEK